MRAVAAAIASEAQSAEAAAADASAAVQSALSDDGAPVAPPSLAPSQPSASAADSSSPAQPLHDVQPQHPDDSSQAPPLELAFSCSDCGASFSTSRGLKMHEKRMHGQRAVGHRFVRSSKCPI
eukprot:14654496-Alexandrium_andersonii.AAC.1